MNPTHGFNYLTLTFALTTYKKNRAKIVLVTDLSLGRHEINAV